MLVVLLAAYCDQPSRYTQLDRCASLLAATIPPSGIISNIAFQAMRVDPFALCCSPPGSFKHSSSAWQPVRDARALALSCVLWSKSLSASRVQTSSYSQPASMKPACQQHKTAHQTIRNERLPAAHEWHKSQSNKPGADGRRKIKGKKRCRHG